jgi:UDP-N-acetylmuramoyl-tripeptide--D-alanyl-D-alanine ligase
MILSLIRLWLGPLPKQEIFPDKKPDPLLHWIIHPIKRRLAKYYLLVLQKLFGMQVIALTGSAGKTTTKHLLHAAFSAAGSTISTADNTTSTYNIPSTILQATPFTKYLILEMGVEYPGDMDFYTWLAHPDIAIILNVNRTHTHFLKSVKNVAREKSKLFSSLPPHSIAILPVSDPLLPHPINLKTYTFGSQPDAFCHILSSKLANDFTTHIRIIINQLPVDLRLNLIGEHLASNAAAALTAAYAAGISPNVSVPTMSTVTPPVHRLQPLTLPSGATIIDDTYNANPLAVSQSLATLVTLTKLTHTIPVFVFGQMNELGQYEQSSHRDIGLLVKKLNIKHFFCHGSATKYSIESAGLGQYFESKESLISHVKRFLSKKYLILIKASRSFKFENVVTALAN